MQNPNKKKKMIDFLGFPLGTVPVKVSNNRKTNGKIDSPLLDEGKFQEELLNASEQYDIAVNTENIYYKMADEERNEMEENHGAE